MPTDADYPHWDHKDGDACPFGVDFLGITTWPAIGNPYTRLNTATVLINVFYSCLPLFFFVFALCRALYAFVFSDAHKLAPSARKQSLHRFQRDGKYIFLSMVVVSITEVEKRLFRVSRPSVSCMYSFGVPDGMEFWATALLSTRIIDLVFSFSVPHLTTVAPDKEGSNGLPPYDKESMQLLGYEAMMAGEMLTQMIVLVLVLGPVPLARIVVGDASFIEVTVGCIQGVLCSICYHVCYVSTLTSRSWGVWIYSRTEMAMIFGGLLGEIFTPCGEEEGRTFWSHGETKGCCSAWREAKTRVIEDEKANPLLRSQPRRSISIPKWNTFTGISDLPGLEFLAIRTDTKLQSLEDGKNEMERQAIALQQQITGQTEELAQILAEKENKVTEIRHSVCAALNWQPADKPFTDRLVPVDTRSPLFNKLQVMLSGCHKSTNNWTRDRGCSKPGADRLPHGRGRCPLSCIMANKAAVPTGYKLVHAYCNQNMKLWQAYAATRSNVLSECASLGRATGRASLVAPYVDEAVRSSDAGLELPTPLTSGCNEWRLFHGSGLEACNNICGGNFLLTFSGTGATETAPLTATFAGDSTGDTASDKLLYGVGIYLAEYATKADEYSDPITKQQAQQMRAAGFEGNIEGLSCILVVRCVGGKSKVIQDNGFDKAQLLREVNGKPYHSVLGDRVTKLNKPFREFIMYESSQIFPEYLLVYQREWDGKQIGPAPARPVVMRR